jgi:glycosyltransferase involved in cell wall biosynthesis
MKILAVEPYTRTPGHFEWFASRTCEGLARRGHEVTLVTFGGLSPAQVTSALPFRIVDAAPKTEQDLDARCYHGKIDLASLRAILKRQLREWRTFRYAFPLLRKEAFDAVHFLGGDAILLFLALHFGLSTRQAERTAIVANLHEAPLLKPPGTHKGRLYKALYRHSLRQLISVALDGLIVLDESFKTDLMARLELNETAAARIQVYPHGTDDARALDDRETARRRLNLSPDETVFLLFGILKKNKRFGLALDAIKGLPSCRLLIAGEPQDYDAGAIQELVHARGCEESVSTEIGYIEPGRLRDYFLASDTVILPYAADFEGQSGILTLACAHGRSVISSDVADVGKTVREAGMGLVVEPESAAKLRGALEKFLSLRPGERLQMEANSRSVAGARSWDAVCGRLESLYSEILNRKRRPGLRSE